MNEMSSCGYSRQRTGTQRDRQGFLPEYSIRPLPADASVTMAYVPFQTDTAVYDEMRALAEGTLFPSLNKPFLGAGDCR